MNEVDLVVIDGDIGGGHDLDAESGVIKHVIPLEQDVPGLHNLHTDPQAVMKSRVRDRAPGPFGTLESESSFVGIGLRAVVDLDAVQEGATQPHLLVPFDKITCHNLASPALDVLTDDLHVSRQ